MRKLQIFLLALLLLLSGTLLTSCQRAAAAAAQEQETPAPTAGTQAADAADTYRVRVAELEEELLRLRQAGTTAKQPETAASPTASTAPQEGGTTGDGMTFTYKVENGAATVTGFRGSTGFIQVPATLEGYPVKKIGQRVFEGSGATVVELPESVTEIDWFAFYGCEGLLYVSVPYSVARMGYGVFDECPRVTVLCEPGSYAEQYAKSYGIPTMGREEG